MFCLLVFCVVFCYSVILLLGSLSVDRGEGSCGCFFVCFGFRFFRGVFFFISEFNILGYYVGFGSEGLW